MKTTFASNAHAQTKQKQETTHGATLRSRTNAELQQRVWLSRRPVARLQRRDSSRRRLLQLAAVRLARW